MNKHLDLIQKEYCSQKTVKEYTGYAVDGIFTSELYVYQKYINEKHRILDIGCGAGRTTVSLFEDGYKNIIGLDLSQPLIENAKKIAQQKGLEIEFVVGNALKLDYKDYSFDTVIFSFSGLFCIPKRENRLLVCKEVFRILKPGGKFIFSFIDREDPVFKIYTIGDDGNHRAVVEGEGIDGRPFVKDCEIGDVYLDGARGGAAFVHYSTVPEVLSLISEAGFRLLYTESNQDILNELRKYGGKVYDLEPYGRHVVAIKDNV